MSFHYNFDKLDLLIYKNQPYRWLDQTEQGFRFASDDELERVITIRHEEMQGLLDNPDARLECGHFGRSRAAVRRNSDNEFLANLPPKKRFKALWGCELGRFGQSLIRSGQMTLSDASIEAALPTFVSYMATWAEQQRLDEKIRDKTRNADAQPKDKAKKRKDSRQTVVQFQMPSVKTLRKHIKTGIECGFDQRLTDRHFALGFADISECDAAMNPFISPDWETIDASVLFAKKKADDDYRPSRLRSPRFNRAV